PGFGVASSDHVTPSHDSTLVPPTALQNVAETHDTLLRTSATFTGVSTDHAGVAPAGTAVGRAAAAPETPITTNTAVARRTTRAWIIAIPQFAVGQAAHRPHESAV